MSHDFIELPVKQYFAQQLDGLAFGDIAVRLDEDVVVLAEEAIKVGTNVL